MSRLIVAIAALLVFVAAIFMLQGEPAADSPAEGQSNPAASADFESSEAQPTTRVVTFDEGNFDELVRRSSKPVLVDFTAGWCGPCHLLSPTIDKLSVEFGESMAFGKVDVDACPKLAEEHKAPPIPLLVLYKDGEVVGRIVGRESEEVIRAALEKLVQPKTVATR